MKKFVKKYYQNKTYMNIGQNDNFYKYFKKQASKTPDKIILESPTYGSFTLGQLLQKIDSVRLFLGDKKIGKRDRILVILPDNFELGLTFLGVASYCQCLPLNPALVSKELDHFIDKLRPAAVIFSSKDNNLSSRIFKDYNNLLLFDFYQLYNSNFKNTPEESGVNKDIAEPQSQDVALMLPTSGTTSTPKIVPLTHFNLCSSAQNIISSLSLSEEDRYLNIMPLFHIHGLVLMLSSLFVSSSIFCAPKFNKKEFFTWMEKFCPTWYSASPTIHQAIISESPQNKETIKGNPLRFIRSSAAPLPPQVADELEEIFQVPVVESYGMTEATLQITSNPLILGQRIPGSAGKPAGPQVATVDSQGDFVEKEGEGEIVIKGDNITRGYLESTANNDNYFVKGWLRTGDWGFLDADNNLFIKGRIKEMINKGGENISPREIEEVLLEHRDIEEAVVFSAPHPTLGEDIMAAIVIKEGAGVEESDIKSYTIKYISDFKVPSRIIALEDIPKNAAGKISRVNFYNQIKPFLKQEYSLSANEIEEKMLQAWKDILKEDDIGTKDNFFEIGGDSLKVQELLHRLSKQNLQISPKQFLNNPTIKDLAKSIKNNKNLI